MRCASHLTLANLILLFYKSTTVASYLYFPYNILDETPCRSNNQQPHAAAIARACKSKPAAIVVDMAFSFTTLDNWIDPTLQSPYSSLFPLSGGAGSP
jgi:hypothetical protein